MAAEWINSALAAISNNGDGTNNRGAARVGLEMLHRHPMLAGACVWHGLTGELLWIAYSDLSDSNLEQMAALDDVGLVALREQARARRCEG